MTIPPEFSEMEHLQSVLRRIINGEIKAAFREVDGDDWQPEVGTTRGSMRQALTHKDNDSLLMTQMRTMLYYFTFGQAQALQAPINIDMTDRPYEDFNMRPEVNLFFDKRVYVSEGVRDTFQGCISYRLTHETSATITPAKNKIRAEKIKTLLTNPKPFRWHKGRLKYTYFDTANGYDLRLLVTGEAEAKRIIEQVLDIENKTPDWDKLSEHKSGRTTTTATQTKLIYGEQRKVPRWRPTEDVPFVRASMKIHGIPKPVPLVNCISNTGVVQVVA